MRRCRCRDFWRRWHITLSRWLRDYVYIPLGGSRRGEARHAVNMMVTMLVGGLWHGAGWTFVAWGGLHGLGQVIGRWRRRSRDERGHRATGSRRPRSCVRGSSTFHLVCLGWVFFRAESLGLGVRRPRPARSPAGARRHAGHPAGRARDRRDAALAERAGTPAVRLQLVLLARGARPAGCRARDRPVRHHGARPVGRRPVHLLPVLTMAQTLLCRCPRWTIPSHSRSCPLLAGEP